MSEAHLREIIALHSAGDLLLPRLKDHRYQREFARFQSMFEYLANLDRSERILNYALLNCLMLTSHARLKSKDEKVKLFELKNRLFVALASSDRLRSSIAFKHLRSSRKFVTSLCPECQVLNQEKGIHTRSKYLFCKKCKVESGFFDVLSMLHRFDKGSVSVFLSKENIPKIKNLKVKHKGVLEKSSEVFKFRDFEFDKKNLDRIVLEDVIRMNEQLYQSLF